MSATNTATKLMTANEFWEYVHRPENEPRNLDLIRGEVIEMPRPTTPHCRVCINVGFELESWARRVGVGYVLSNDPGVVLEEDPDSVIGPDVAYFVNGETFEDLHPKWNEFPPVLAVEVLSPNDRPGRVNAKVATYLRGGTKLIWLVDYEERTVTVYRSGRDLVILKATDIVTGDAELPGFACEVAEFFRLPGQPAG
jgi:Uma2 family endonuclease